MSQEINVVSRTQQITVVPGTSTVSVTNAGPQGPGGIGTTDLEPRVEDLEELWVPTGTALTGPIVHHPGPVLTNHDALYWDPSEFKGNATYAPNGSTKYAPAWWSFPDNATQWIKWLWYPQEGWEFYTVRFGVIVLGFDTPAQSRWRYSEERFLINTDDPGGSVINTPVEVASVTVPPIDFSGTGNFYGNIAANVVAPSPFEMTLSMIERVHDHADSDQTGGMGVWGVTATRTDGP